MKHPIFKVAASLICLTLLSVLTFGQATTSSLSGSVTDPTGAVVASAVVTVRNNATGQELKAPVSSSGTYTIPALGVGSYTVTVEAQGFKKAIVNDVKIDAATPATVNIALEVGAQSETVVIQGGAEVLQTQSANISTTIQGRQITELPFTSRDALDLVLLLPGTNTPGRPRTSTINGLPKGALNITIDGVNVQDNLIKSSDGFFTYIRPRIDAIDEVTVSTATPGAESSGEGAVQIKFVTRGGSNEFHGSVYEYHRNPALNANYWFNNRDLKPDPRTGKAPRDRVLLNQYGFRLGGPIWVPKVFNGRDKAFFFVNYEEYKLPEQASRQRTILNPLAQQGIIQWNVVENGQTVTKQFPLLTEMGNKTCGSAPCPSTVDPTVGPLLAQIRKASETSGAIQQNADPNFQTVSFTNSGNQARFFPTVRLDFNLSSKHHLENVWNYQKFTGGADFLNGVDPAFPGFPNFGIQGSRRFSNSLGLRSTLTSSLVNEARFGLSGGTVLFFPNVNPAQFANQGGYSLGIGAAGISGATATRSPSRRNSPTWQFNDTVNWTRGAHAMSFGLSYTQVNYWSSNPVDGVVRAVGFGIAANDPANALFVTNNFPSGFPLGTARGIYATLVGRVTSISGAGVIDEKTNKYSANGDRVQRGRQREMGLFAQDSWRFRQNLTVNAGLRWEVQFPFRALNNAYSQTSYAELFGLSGEGNIFKPGTLTGTIPQYRPFTQDDALYKTSYDNFAPSLGIAWSPNFKDGLLSKVFGEGGQTVVRGGYSIAYNREGTNTATSIVGANPGATFSLARNVANVGTNTLTPGTMLRNGLPGPDSFNADPQYPFPATLQTSVNAVIPNLKLGYVQSWTFGIQREINRDTVFEVRYTGNHGTSLWRQYNLNETNVVENNFADEFKKAQANLLYNIANGKGVTFAYTGAGTSPLPILAGYLQGLSGADLNDPTKYTSARFRDQNVYGFLSPDAPNVIGLANYLQFNPALGYLTNAANAKLAANLFIVNPTVGNSGAFVIDNGGSSTYNALTFELRRRLSKGLLVQGSYTFAKAMANTFASSSAVFDQPITLRYPGLSKSLSPFNVKHGFKVNWIYELPFGKGKTFLGNVGRLADLAVGGWEFHGTARVQSGTPFSITGVDLVNMTAKELQDKVGLYFDNGARRLYFLPDDVRLNTIKAFNPGFFSAQNITGVSRNPTLGAPDANGKYIAPVNLNNRIVTYSGERGLSRVVLYGPKFQKYDLSAVKRFKITETVNFEFRAEFLNAFNHINFIVGNPGSDVNTVGSLGSQDFGLITQAYRDLSTTNDPGGRLIQFVARINF